MLWLGTYSGEGALFIIVKVLEHDLLRVVSGADPKRNAAHHARKLGIWLVQEHIPIPVP